MPHQEDVTDNPRKKRRGVIYPLLLSTFAGSVIGIAVFTFGYANGASYLTNDPSACANCHVMRANYQSWLKSSHGKVAVCNDCHTPPGIVAKYRTKAQNGFLHSLAFTTQRFPDDIMITNRSRKVTESACRKCHGDIVAGIEMTRRDDQKISCIRCHRSVGHL